MSNPAERVVLVQTMTERAQVFVERLAGELKRRGYKVERELVRGVLSKACISRIDGVPVDLSIEFEHCSSYRASSYTGRLRMRVGQSRNFPEPNAGFDLEKAIKRVLQEKSAREASNAAAALRRKQEAARDKYLKEAYALMPETVLFEEGWKPGFRVGELLVNGYSDSEVWIAGRVTKEQLVRICDLLMDQDSKEVVV